MGNYRLVMYDVRGIQDYIYRTNKVKEIIGASEQVEKLLQDGFLNAIQKESQKEKFIIKWYEGNGESPIKELRISKDDSIQMEVLFIGGGNGYVLFRDDAVMHRINRRMSKFIMEETYSLRLAIASIETELQDYLEDYKKLQNRMAYVKANMTDAHPMCGGPVIETDAMTGFPYSVKRDGELFTTEASKKRAKVDELLQSDWRTARVEQLDRIFDNMVTDKGSDSILSIVHIDGNNLGGRIKSIIESEAKDSYEKSVFCVRTLSLNIRNKFSDAFIKTKEKLEEWVKSDKCCFNNKQYQDGSFKAYMRKIIVAGDDITFVCNGKVALSIVEYFLKCISKEVMYGDKNKAEDMEKYGLSACAGIAYINSHFAFREGYKMAEECCESAKKRAKLDECVGWTGENNTGMKIIGNYIDFHICKHIDIADIEAQRDGERIPDGTVLYKRPYFVPYGSESGKFTEIDSKNSCFSIEDYKKRLAYFCDNEKIPRSFSKQLRSAYVLGKHSVDEYLTFLKSRSKDLKEILSEDSYDNQVAAWYDALDLMDLYIDIQEV
ncbi:MAG: hypothetical protein K6G26_04745 [Lachnospiraceae bacterium]|nr:hypothetical protein [Lachnospiraceae bacterium]